ncbi:MAG: cytochrome c oxidase subunit 3 [Venatoribacter sp.]
MTSANLTNTAPEPELAASTKASTQPQKHIPGDIALWFFLMAELAVFGILILGFALVRVSQPDMFLAGLEKLHLNAGIINTMVLLTGSYLAALGVIRVRNQQAAGKYLVGAALTGVIYMVVKMSEYVDLFSQGYSLHYDTFFGFYFFATFFHFLHVAAGVVILLLVANWLRKTQDDQEKRVQAAESIASYWHMVDIVWIVLFPTLYLLK